MNAFTEEAIVVADTENHRQGDGYERTLIYKGWDRNDRHRMARVTVRVDRSPPLSFARADVWVPSSGWQYVTAIGPEEWWGRMPGYTRGQTHLANRLVLDIADELIETLAETGI